MTRPRFRLGRRPGPAHPAALALILAAWTGLAGLSPVRAETPLAVVARPGAGEVLDLRQCIELARAHNDEILGERHRLGELGGQVWQAAATGLPTVDLVGEWSRSRDPSFALDETFGGGGDGGMTLPAPFDTLFGNFDFLPAPEDVPAQSFWRTSVNAHWTLNPVQLVGALSAASSGVRRQELAIEAVEHRVVERTVAAYHGVLLAAERVAAREAELANQGELLEIMKLRFELGLATELDTLQAAVAAANVEPEVRRARLELLTAGARLNSLLGRAPEYPVAIRPEQDLELQAIDVQAALALAGERPDVQQQALYVRMLARGRQVRKAELLPYLSADAAYGYLGKQWADLNDTGHDFWRASASLNLPVFDGLLSRGRIKEAAASVRRAEHELSTLRRQAEVEILETLDGLAAARRNLRAAELNVARAERLQEQMAALLQAGKTSYLSVLEAEAGRALARSNLIQARYDVLTLTAALKRAVGRSPALALAEIPGLAGGEER